MILPPEPVPANNPVLALPVPVQQTIPITSAKKPKIDQDNGISNFEAQNLKERCLSFLKEQLKETKPSFPKLKVMVGLILLLLRNGMEIDNSDLTFGIHPFYIEKGDNHVEAKGFEFLAPTTRRNSMRVLRAMQLKKPGTHSLFFIHSNTIH
ncbi:AAA+ ATPase domain-containing protein [Artemisia annua]|uniref:AAA+ ATPase domain-containing protein n=1 Tax=Artemisia annua TaxID=35608 RepID=A0A2U1KAK9_ARTAN|nr:AAA+ ATPase domain-containing protein [Artemisia annua]